MKKYFTLLLLMSTLLMSGTSLLAQQRGQRPGGPRGAMPKFKVEGRIVDEATGNPLEYATVTLFSYKDSSMVAGGITDMNGKFSFETRPGRLYAKIEFLSYTTLIIDRIPFDRELRKADLGIVKLQSDAAMLDEVEVRAEKSQMQMTLDKKVFNVGKDLANRGGTAEDILDNVPSVAVDLEGNVSLRGSNDVRVLVNGKPSGLIGVGDLNGLRQIPSNLIERVEVITNPSARYEAEGMSGIINIVLRKDKKSGLNGSFDITAGYPENFGAAVNMNYRRKDINFFANYGVSYRKRPGEGFNYQELYRGDTTYILDQDRTFERGGLSNSVRLGMDYFLGEKTTLTGAFLYKVSDEDNFNTVTYRDYINSFPDNLQSVTYRTDDEKEDEDNLEYSLQYKRTFSRKGQELTADFQFQENTEVESSDFTETYFFPNGEPGLREDLEQRSANSEGEKRTRFQIDYVHPFSKDGQFEIGSLISIRDIKNDYLVEEWADNRWVSLEGFSNNFVYDEDIYAAYFMLGNKYGKFSYQAGLRGELSNVRTELLQTNEVNDRTYFNFFPTVHLSYELPNQHNVQISYSRRLRRPRFWYLNPFVTFSDARNVFAGNPNLDPSFTDSYELSHIKYWDKASFSSSIYYRYSTGVIRRIRDTDLETGNATIIPKNLATEDSYGLELTFSASPKKWLRLNGDVNFFRSIINGDNVGNNSSADALSMLGRITSRMTFWKKTDVQIRANYRAPRETPQGRNKAIYHMDFAASKDILKGNGTLTFSINDVFNSRRRRYITIEDSARNEGEFQWRARQFTLALNYRLNQKKKRGRRGGRGGYDGGGGEMGF
ncbi:MAG: TonB-dependent receptor [Bacteroidota bacterium]